MKHFLLPLAASVSVFSSLCSAEHVSNTNTKRDDSQDLVYNARLQLCPQSCDFLGPDPSQWTTYSDLAELALCPETVLFTLNVFNILSEDNDRVRITACSTGTGGSPGLTSGEFRATYLDDDSMPLESPRIDVVQRRNIKLRRQDTSMTCGAVPKTVSVDLEEASSGTSTSNPDAVKNAMLQLSRHIKADVDNCGQMIMFAAADHLQVVVGAVIGGDVDKNSAGKLLEASYRPELASSATIIQQSCTDISRGRGIGMFADLNGDVTAVQKALGTWVKGECLDSAELGSSNKKTSSAQLTILTSPFDDKATTNSTSSSTALSARSNSLSPRALCRDIQVKSGDGCGSLATRCGISGANFEKFNSKIPNLCSTLKDKQFVCCSTGDLPDHTPQPQANGICYTYDVTDGDTGCWDIADRHFITVEDIEAYNKKTWGWGTCGNLNKYTTICLSKGNPPMPKEDPTALCGPTVVGSSSKRPSNWTLINDMNPCPINACCNVWGQCGFSKDFCIPYPIKGGGPGSSERGKNGCVASCGLGLRNNDKPPAQFRSVGYFEAWNKERSCLHMDITEFDDSRYTHIHFAFATITTDFKVNVTAGEVGKQFAKLRTMNTRAKKILSFGGWAFSNDYATSPIFRQSVSDANRQAFANAAVKFAKDNNLDGLDFDWEYPGAYDIPGSVPGHKDDGANYLKFLEMVKKQLPSGMTLSIALPASYWYLRGFPVEKMSKVVDYFVYMTYDLHGQWDYGSKWSSPGCPTGNCLRSHVNRTETWDALGMVTKAGAQAAQVLVGVSSYGRSFKMADPNCTGFMCKFTGSNTTSLATKGDCTKEAGYISDAEINEIIALSKVYGEPVKTWSDHTSASDFMVWDGTWVGYMSKKEKEIRTEEYKDINFGGITDWAVDLQEFRGDEGSSGDGDEDSYGGTPVESCDEEYADLAAVANDASNIPSHCWAFYTLGGLSKELSTAMEKYDDIKGDYDGKFKWYSRYINDMIDPTIRDWLNARENPKGGGELTGKGNKYFKCKYKNHGETSWRYEGDCPIPDDKRGPWSSQDIEYTVKNQKEFEEGIAEDLGIGWEWLQWGTKDYGHKCDGQSPQTCQNSIYEIYTGNYPVKKSKIDIPNPQKILEAAKSNLTNIETQLAASLMSTGLGLFNEDGFNDVDSAISLGSLIGQIAQAVDSMGTVIEIGEDVEEQHKKNLILNIVSLLLLVVPIAGEFGAALAGLTRLARFARFAGEAGDLAQGLAEIAADPSAAPMVIAELLLGSAGAGKKPEQRYRDGARAREGLGGTDLSRMGSVYKGVDDKVQKVCKRCV
ncbi:hypothetical protein F5X68DRAFT_239170 [Plectosphaerella plurivora]|uniref:chitinase n=1 Tax=Plectosphaerella plurivora TaxID=936078 RepID=A0A9P8VDF6_9PEZI|nr:hypothetical protein F5X68DRAFT_239170 [Plectosphaerella plurivora]